MKNWSLEYEKSIVSSKKLPCLIFLVDRFNIVIDSPSSAARKLKSVFAVQIFTSWWPCEPQIYVYCLLIHLSILFIHLSYFIGSIFMFLSLTLGLSITQDDWNPTRHLQETGIYLRLFFPTFALSHLSCGPFILSCTLDEITMVSSSFLSLLGKTIPVGNAVSSF